MKVRFPNHRIYNFLYKKLLKAGEFTFVIYVNHVNCSTNGFKIFSFFLVIFVSLIIQYILKQLFTSVSRDVEMSILALFNFISANNNC